MTPARLVLLLVVLTCSAAATVRAQEPSPNGLTGHLTAGVHDGTPKDGFTYGVSFYTSVDFPIVPPGGTVTQSFNRASGLGLYAFTWDTDVSPLVVNAGTFVVNAEWWDGNPLAGGSFVRAAPHLTAPYSVAVAAAPEPASTGLLMFGAGALLI